MAAEENGKAAPETDGDGVRWDAYSDYQNVSERVSKTIEQAVHAYARVDSYHAEGATMPKNLAAEARGRILAATLRLMPELQHDRGSVDEYDEILSRWEGEDGYIAELSETSLRAGRPGWLLQLILDIQTAGWEIGYLQAGRSASADPELPNPDKEFEEMFADY